MHKTTTKGRYLTETEKKIIERDANEQRTLSGELNGRTSLVAALIVVGAAIAPSLTSASVNLPSVQRIAFIALLVSWVLFWKLAIGEDYKYPKLESEWVKWMDEESLGPDEAKKAEDDLAEKYYRALLDAAWEARKANQRKSKLLKITSPLSIGLIILILVSDLLARL